MKWIHAYIDVVAAIALVKDIYNKPRATLHILGSLFFKCDRHIARKQCQLAKKNCFCETHSRQVTSGNNARRCFDLVLASNVWLYSISTKFFRQGTFTSFLTVCELKEFDLH